MDLGLQGFSEEIESILEKIVEVFQDILKDDLIGIYLHGSLAMGCFNPEKSDIDFLVVVKKKLSAEIKRSVVKSTLNLANSDGVPEKGLEFSIVEEKYLKDFIHPTPFEFHYSKDWRKAYEEDKVDLNKENTDRDLAAHITVIINRGIRIYGKSIKEVFPYRIPVKYYIDSLLYDAESVKEDIYRNPVYGILNLCRVIYFLEEGVISSKKEAGLWGIKHLPGEFTPLVLKALKEYNGELKDNIWEKDNLQEFVSYMSKRINFLLTLS